MISIEGIQVLEGSLGALQIGTDVACDLTKNVCSSKTPAADAAIKALQTAINSAAWSLGIQTPQLVVDGVIGSKTMLLAIEVSKIAATFPALAAFGSLKEIAAVNPSDAKAIGNFVQALAMTPDGFAQAFNSVPAVAKTYYPSALPAPSSTYSKVVWWIVGGLAVAGLGYYYFRRRKAY